MFDEMEDTRKILCERCRKFVSITDIKYLPKGDNARMALCKSCLKGFSVADEKRKQAAAARTAKLSGGKSCFCSRCNYKFKYNTESNAVLRCPYCSKSDKVREDKDIDADSLLREADE